MFDVLPPRKALGVLRTRVGEQGSRLNPSYTADRYSTVIDSGRGNAERGERNGRT